MYKYCGNEVHIKLDRVIHKQNIILQKPKGTFSQKAYQMQILQFIHFQRKIVSH